MSESSFFYPLHSLESTVSLAKALSLGIKETKTKALLLYGDLGLGKTTLTAAFTRNFSGGNLAEVASPSFTLCNIYSTSPEIHHYDLYRLTQGMVSDELLESFETPNTICVVEWAERILQRDLPENALCCTLICNEKEERFANIHALGTEGKKAFDFITFSCLQEKSIP